MYETNANNNVSVYGNPGYQMAMSKELPWPFCSIRNWWVTSSPKDKWGFAGKTLLFATLGYVVHETTSSGYQLDLNMKEQKLYYGPGDQRNRM